MNNTFIFGPDQDSVQCLSISIIDDNLLESEESLMLSLSMENGETSRATVYIMDNECKDQVLNYIVTV